MPTVPTTAGVSGAPGGARIPCARRQQMAASWSPHARPPALARLPESPTVHSAPPHRPSKTAPQAERDRNVSRPRQVALRLPSSQQRALLPSSSVALGSGSPSAKWIYENTYPLGLF